MSRFPQFRFRVIRKVSKVQKALLRPTYNLKVLTKDFFGGTLKTYPPIQSKKEEPHPSLIGCKMDRRECRELCIQGSFLQRREAGADQPQSSLRTCPPTRRLTAKRRNGITMRKVAPRNLCRALLRTARTATSHSARSNRSASESRAPGLVKRLKFESQNLGSLACSRRLCRRGARLPECRKADVLPRG